MPAAADLARNRVGAEFLGLARDLRRRIGQADAALPAAIDRICKQVRDRAARHPAPRPDQLRTLAHRWMNDLPELGRLASDARLSARNLLIDEIRVMACVQRIDGWQGGDDEPGLVVVQIQLTIGRGAFRRVVTNVASVSLHALARRYERTRDRSDLSVLGDLRALAVPDPVAACAPDGAFRLETPSGGAWIGRLARADGVAGTFLAARSYFVSDD